MTYKESIKKALEEGLLLFAKYALVLFLISLAINIFTNLNSGAANGTQAAIYLNQLMEKGYLPKAINGQVPPKEESHEKTSINSTPTK